jgi:putative endonuclease
VTDNLIRRVAEHKQGKAKGFTSKYNIKTLVYFESGGDINEALFREKQIKGWLRKKKVALIEKENPEWKDLSKDWFK